MANTVMLGAGRASELAACRIPSFYGIGLLPTMIVATRQAMSPDAFLGAGWDRATPEPRAAKEWEWYLTMI